MRRGLIRPDVLPRGRGHNALFGWRTLLVLRLLALVHIRFGGTVAHWGPIMDALRASLEGSSFPALYGHAAVYDGARMVISPASPFDAKQALLTLPLDEHLAEISRAFGPEEDEVQLPLLPPLLVKR
ncbi:hypothetical protein [Microvirga sp. M2]|uniref:hypothetical protein n=1 Tax=Microvirga sp. M2 TaxID=3073270 RepID=UPI0039C38517